MSEHRWRIAVVGLATLFSLVTSKSVAPSQQNQPNYLDIFKGYYSYWGKNRLQTIDIQQNCQELWALTDKEFTKVESKGVLGSLEQLERLCPTNSSDLSLACQGAIGLSNYLCSVAHGKQHETGKSLSPASVTAEDVKKLSSNASELCLWLEATNLPQKLITIIEKKSEKSLSNFGNSSLPYQKHCQEICSGNSQHLCRIFIQGLRTVYEWEEDPKGLRDDQQQNLNMGADSQLEPSSNNPDPFEDKNVASDNQGSIPNELPLAQRLSEAQIIESTTPATTTPVPVSDLAATTTQPATKPATQPVTSTAATTAMLRTTTLSAAEPAKTSSTAPSGTPKATPLTFQPEQEMPAPGLTSTEMEEPQPDSDPDLTIPMADLPDAEGPYSDEDNAEKGMEAEGHENLANPMRNEPATGFVNDSDHMDEPEDTHFLLYFITFALVTIGGYVIYMRRNRIIALVIQGRGASSSRRRASRSSSRDSRPSGGSYRKLVNNLEEVITSSQSVKNSNVIY